MCHYPICNFAICKTMFRDGPQISHLILREFERINQLLCPMKGSESNKFSDTFRGNRCSLIRFSLLNVRGKIWWHTLKFVLPENA